MTPKLRSRRKSLNKEVLRQVTNNFKPELTHNLPWIALEELTRDLPRIPDELKSLLTEVIENKSINGYMGLQPWADPQKYVSALEYFSATAALSFLKKYPFGKVADLDPLATAKSKFYLAEKLCRMTNKRLKWFRHRGYRHSNRWQGVHSVFHTARLYISNWLGPLDLNQIYDYTRHGPGGALGVTGSRTTKYWKYAAETYTVTTRAQPYAEAAILADPLWRRYVVTGNLIGDSVPDVSESREAVRSKLRVVNHNKVTFVPKTAQTHRAIAVEPLMNIFLQLGVGDFLSDLLKKVGCNLRSQSRNQHLAWEGSIKKYSSWDNPVTLDLSMASDTISMELVRDLLPEEWFNFLFDLRSPNGVLEGEEIRWAKFSSMGNGYTFPLESMIFYALSLSVAKHLGYRRDLISVYGDDIIVPAGMALRLIDVFAYAGFRVNTDKSFFFGPFRESCGSDWFEGRNVRPFFLHRKIQNAKDLVFVINSLERMDHRFSGDPRYLACDSFTYRKLRSYLPSLVNRHLLGPVVEDLEAHLFSPLDKAMTSALVKWNPKVQTWSYASLKSSPRVYRGRDGPLYLQMMDRSESGHGIPPPRSVKDQALIFDSWSTDVVKNSDVVQRQDTRLVLATQVSNDWRND